MHTSAPISLAAYDCSVILSPSHVTLAQLIQCEDTQGERVKAMKLSASQAAKEAGVSVMTITRACKSGRLSYEGGKGEPYMIDRAELYRVYPPKSDGSGVVQQMLSGATVTDAKLLEVKLDAADKQIEYLKAALDDMRGQRDKWQQQATALLTDQRSAAQESWWTRIWRS